MLELKFLNKDNASFKPTPAALFLLNLRGKFIPAFIFTAPFLFRSRRIYFGERKRGQKQGNRHDKKFKRARRDPKACEKQLELRYFTPKITSVYKVKEEYGYSYWDVNTDRGPCRFTADANGVVKLSATRLIVNDVDGNRFEIPDVSALSSKELRMIDLYI